MSDIAALYSLMTEILLRIFGGLRRFSCVTNSSQGICREFTCMPSSEAPEESSLLGGMQVKVASLFILVVAQPWNQLNKMGPMPKDKSF